MQSLLFIIALGIAAIVSIMFPPFGTLLLIALGLWVTYVIVKGGVKGLNSAQRRRARVLRPYRAAASNDLHAVVVQTAPDTFYLQTFEPGVHAIANARWIAGEHAIADVSSNGAGCTDERRWKWNSRPARFVLAGQKRKGCRPLKKG